MDPNPKSFPFLSYVLSRLPISTSSFSSAADLEQPPPSPDIASCDTEVGLATDLMPALDCRPSLLASMAAAVSNVAQARSVLRVLGDRPDHEAVDAARSRLAEADADLVRRLEGIVRAPRPAGVDRLRWRGEQAERERECRDAADKERAALRAVMQLDEMHEAYESLLWETEKRLERMYRGEGSRAVTEPLQRREQTNDEFVGILEEGLAKCMERVDIAGRQLRFLPEAFGKLQSLISLNLSNNLLELIPDSIAGLQYLEELRLSSNIMVALPDSIGLLSNLKVLDVSGNKLKVLPDSISKCRSLVDLDASYNELAYLPTNIGYELLNLEKLWIHLNKIRSLPSSICEMRSLRLLDAHFNEIRGLPRDFGRLTNLEVLNLSSNFSDMLELPDSFGKLINLKELDLSNNQIHALPHTFGRLDKLTKLNLDQNPLKVPPMEIINKGVDAVKDYMAKHCMNMLLEEERKIMAEESSPTRAGWLTRSKSWLNSWVSGVSEGVTGILGPAQKSPKYPYLDEML